jgi:hypothetical protein
MTKLDWTNTDASNQPDYASEAFEQLAAAFAIYKQAWADHCPVGKRPVFSVRTNGKGELQIGVALANGSSKNESLSVWLERNKFRS